MKTKIIEYLENLDDQTLLQLHNDYCDHNKYCDDHIFYMAELDDLLYGKTPSEIIDIAGGIDTNDDYLRYTIYGVQSFDNVSDFIDLDALAEYIIDEDEDLNDDELREILDNGDDEE